MSRAVVLLRVEDRSVTARQRFRETATRLQEHLGGVHVHAAHVVPGKGPNEVSLTHAVEQCVAQGATEIAVVPYEIEWPVYDVNDNIQDLALEHPEVRIHLAQPLGVDDGAVPALANRYTAAWSLPEVAHATVEEMVIIAAQPPIAQPSLRDAEVPQLPAHDKHVLICVGRICQQNGSSTVYETLTSLLDERGMAPPPAMHGLLGRQRKAAGNESLDAHQKSLPTVKVTRTKCLQPCAGAPVACVYPEGTFFYGLVPDLVPRFVDDVLAGNGTLPGHTFHAGE